MWPFRSARRVFAVGALALLAACQAIPPAAPPPPAPPPAPPPPVQLPPPPVAVEADKPWDVAPLTAGNWSYRQEGDGSVASFGFPGGAPALSFRCALTRREVQMSIAGTSAPATAAVRTSAGTLGWSGVASPDGTAALRIVRPATDTGFDWIAFSRGRISIEMPGRPRLIVPVWAEVSRVIEDCRR